MSASTGTLLVVGGRVDTVRKAVEGGLRVVLLQHAALLKPAQAELATATLLVDYIGDWPAAARLVEAARDSYGFGHVVSLAEQATETVGRINDLLGLDGTPHQVSRRFRDKWLMRQHLAGRFAGTVPAAAVGSAEDIREFAAVHGYPAILKPADGTGSRGVVRVDRPEQAEDAWAELAGLRERADRAMSWLFPVTQLIAEAYVEGPEYSVETFSFAGRHVVVAVTEKLTAGFIEAGHAQPARLAPADEDAIVGCVEEFLTLMGLRDGVAHTEVRLGPDGPRVIESHDRVGGDRIMDLVEQVYGVDLEAYAVRWPFRLVPELTGRPAPLRAAATRFLSVEPGTVTAVAGVDEVRADPDVVALDVAVSEGDTVGPVRDNFDRLGQIVAVGPDATAAVATCDRLLARISIVTTPAPDPDPPPGDGTDETDETAFAGPADPRPLAAATAAPTSRGEGSS